MEEFELHLEVVPNKMGDFTETLIDYEIDNEIIGKTEDGNIIVLVKYDNDQQEGIGDLLEIAELYELDDEDEDEDENEEED